MNNFKPAEKINRLQPVPPSVRSIPASIQNRFQRTEHGAFAWGVRDQRLRQPQDGALKPVHRIRATGAPIDSSASLMIDEPEDARLTGGTRSLMRRLLGLNVLTAAARRAGQPSSAQSTHAISAAPVQSMIQKGISRARVDAA